MNSQKTQKEKTPFIQCSLLNAGYARHNADWNFGPICSAINRIYYVTKGEADVVIKGQHHHLSPGHLYIIPAFTTHTDICKGVFEHYYIHFVDPTQNLQTLYSKYEMPFEIDCTPHLGNLIEDLLALCPDIPLETSLPSAYETSPNMSMCLNRFNSYHIGMRMEISAILQQLLAQFLKNSKKSAEVSDNRIYRILWYIDENINSELAIDDLADQLGVCKNRFIRLFSQQTGITPNDYIVRRKMHFAQIYFTEGRHLIKEVARDLGYDNVSYFGRTFKRVVGLGPREFIAQNT